MEKLRVKMSLEQYEEAKLLFNASSEDQTSREALRYMHYKPEGKRLCCTDSHILRFWEMDFGGKELLIAPESFQLTLTQIKKLHGIKRDDTQIFEVDLILKQDCLPFPEVDRVIPCEDMIKPIIGLALGGNLLGRMFKTFPKRSNVTFNMLFTSQLGGVLLTNDIGLIIGLIMPSRPADIFGKKIRGINKKLKKADKEADDLLC